MKGFNHTCSDQKFSKSMHRCSLKDTSFSDNEVSLIWDFYVTHSFAAENGMSVKLSDYGWDDTVSKTNGYPALEAALARNAGVTSFCVVRNKTIKDTLSAMDLSADQICISHARAVMMQGFSYESDENENVKIRSEESRVNALFRHVRNSLAHSNTYIFNNGMCLLEDKDKSKITAEILIPQRSLIDWIYIVDRNGNYYQQ